MTLTLSQPAVTAHISERRENGVSIRSILALSFFFLAVAHFSVKTIFPNPVLWVMAAVIMVFAGTGWIIFRKDEFGFLLVIFICTHFAFGENQGGLWSYVIFAILLARRLLSQGRLIQPSAVPIHVHLLLVLFLVHHFFGTLLNPYSMVSKVQAMIIALSQVLIFYYCAARKMTRFNTKRLLFIWYMVACWVFVMALNQKFGWIGTPSPLLPQRHLYSGDRGSTPAGSFNNSELFSEYFCIVFLFSLVILFNQKELKALRANGTAALSMAFMAACAIMMGASRAAALLAGAGVFFLFFVNAVITPSFQNMGRIIILSLLLSVCGLVMLQMGNLISVDEMKADFGQIEYGELDFSSIISGKGINRGHLFTSAVERLAKKPWWIGRGYNLRLNNKKTLGLQKYRAEDYHSLYLCLPFFYGWGGAAAYVLLVMATAVRIFISYLNSRKLKHFLVPVALGLSIMWGVYILDQYKISATRNPSYFLLMWMMLGLTHGVANTLRGIRRDAGGGGVNEK